MKKCKNRKDAVKTVVAVLCAALMLTACGSKETTSNETASTETTSVTATEATVAEPTRARRRGTRCRSQLHLLRGRILLLQNLLHLPWNPQQHP